MGIVMVQPPKERQLGPYKQGRCCPRCHAELRTTNPGPICDPCELAVGKLIQGATEPPRIAA